MTANKKYLIKLAGLMTELSNSNISEIWELGYSLADNMIIKIGIYVAIENNINLPQRKNFPAMYDIIANSCNLALYNNDVGIRTFHSDRNLFAHKQQSIRLGVRRERAIAYAERVKEIMVAVGLIANKSEIISTNLDNKEYEKYMCLKNIRNKIIHEGTRADEQEAKKCLDLSIEIIKEILDT